MTEVVIIEPQKTATAIFHVDLPDIIHDAVVDLALGGIGRSGENETQSQSRQSWKLQLLRLVQEAPQPTPVLCNEPRQFPHSGMSKRFSESSWASDTTNSTDVTESRSASSTSLDETKGENQDEAGKDAKAALSPRLPSFLHGPSFKIAEEEKGNHADIICPSEETNGNVLKVCANKPKDNQQEVAELNIAPQKYLNLRQTTGGNPTSQGHHQLQKNEGKRRTISLSIQGDSEYWEKFRHSKDYQSSLMIETICNEVFNLRPSPRYKNLMKLSQRNKSTLRNRGNGGKQKEEGSTQLLVIESSNDKDERGIKVEMTDKQEEKTKDKVKTISTLQSHRSDGERDEVGNNKRFSCFHQQGKRNNDDDGGGGGGRNGSAEHGRPDGLHQEGERKQSYISTTSSVFTVTTSGELDDENCNEYRSDGRVERMLMSEGFHPTFHGYLTKGETENLLRDKGQYLIRQVWKEDGFILSFRFDGEIRNYRITCEAGPTTTIHSSGKTRSSGDGHSAKHNGKYRYYLENRRKWYSSLDELVQEGLLTLHLDENAGSYIDLLVELAQFQRNDNMLQTPPAVTPGSRKTSRSASFRATRIASSSSAAVNGPDGGGSAGSSIPLNVNVRNSMDMALTVHFFEDEAFEGLAKCQVCPNGLWGPSGKGLRCRDCGLVVHESCIDNVKNECKPDLRRISPFSTDLTTLVKGSCSLSGAYGPPYILEKCINELEVRGIETEGIYRVSGSSEEIENLKNMFEREKINSDLSTCQDIHSIGSLVKFFFRQLPDPLITQEVFEEYTNAEAGEMTPETIQSLLLSLPPAHRLTLKYFLEHLNRVTKEKAENKMNAFNLSSVLLPSMIGPSNMSFDNLESGAKLLYFLITHADEIKY